MLERNHRSRDRREIVSITTDVEQDTFGFSVHLEYDAAKLLVTAVEQGAATALLEPEFFNGSNDPGSVNYGVLFQLAPPFTRWLNQGEGQEIIRLGVEAVASLAVPAQVLPGEREVPGTFDGTRQVAREVEAGTGPRRPE